MGLKKLESKGWELLKVTGVDPWWNLLLVSSTGIIARLRDAAWRGVALCTVGRSKVGPMLEGMGMASSLSERPHDKFQFCEIRELHLQS